MNLTTKPESMCWMLGVFLLGRSALARSSSSSSSQASLEGTSSQPQARLNMVFGSFASGLWLAFNSSTREVLAAYTSNLKPEEPCASSALNKPPSKPRKTRSVGGSPTKQWSRAQRVERGRHSVIDMWFRVSSTRGSVVVAHGQIRPVFHPQAHPKP